MHRLPNLLGIPAQFLVISLALLLIQSTPAVAWSATGSRLPVAGVSALSCDGSDCTVKLTFTGHSETWVAPANSGNFRIEVAGASGGGDSGGSGALIRANLKLKPGEQLQFVLGGAGKRGGSSSGGFNGGGKAGAGSNAAASGGGMSQLFLPALSASPILIAGGGGGSGGGDRAAGGAAGLKGVSGENSKNSTGGGGAEQTRPGQAGKSGWVLEEATAGQPGQGGTGATVQRGAPGGGGGGGHFGGGGGGASFADCCQPGSGGGGGSSFIDSKYLTEVEFSEAPIGPGFAIIRYQLLPTVASHQWQQFDSSSGDLRLEFTAPITSLRLDRVSVLGCERVSAIPSSAIPAKSWNIKLQSCGVKDSLLVFAAGSIQATSSDGNPLFGPALEISFPIQFANPAATLKLQGSSLFTESTATVLLLAGQKLSGFTASDLQIAGCSLSSIKSIASGFEIKLRDCNDGQHTLKLLAGSISDSLGNQLPKSDLVHRFGVDLLVPVVSLRLLELNEETGIAKTELLLSEPVDSALKQLEGQLSQAGCESEWDNLSSLKFVGSLACEAPITLRIAANSLSDFAGRVGPALAVTLTIDFNQTESPRASSADAIPPWIPIGEATTQPPADPNVSATAGRDQPIDSQTSVWFPENANLSRYFGIGLLLLLALVLGISSLRMARSRAKSVDGKSGKNNGSPAVDKYPVFSKPAHRLG